MRIGILTFHFVYNYGAMLQAYALSNSIRELEGVECEIIDYRPSKINSFYRPQIFDFFKKPIVSMKRAIRKKISHTKYYEFEKFLTESLSLSRRIDNDVDFRLILDKYDIVVVGSDQVWNPYITGYDKNYLLYNNMSNIKKISYAASFGVNIVDKIWEQYIAEALLGFRKISVREKEGQEIIKKIMPKLDSEVIPDPVFLLSRELWRSLEKKVLINDKYILYYSLGKSKNLELEVIKQSKLHDLKIISIHPMFKCNIGKCRCDIGPLQFLWLIDNAEYVYTDSFHATAFSVIFEKTIVINYEGIKGNRITNLLNQLGYTIELEEKKIVKCYFKNSAVKLRELRESGKKFLHDYIGE